MRVDRCTRVAEQSVAAADCIALGASSSSPVPSSRLLLPSLIPFFFCLLVGRDRLPCPAPAILTHACLLSNRRAVRNHRTSLRSSPLRGLLPPLKPPGNPSQSIPQHGISSLTAGATGICGRRTADSSPSLSFSSCSWLFYLLVPHHHKTCGAILLQTCFLACLCCSY